MYNIRAVDSALSVAAFFFSLFFTAITVKITELTFLHSNVSEQFSTRT